VQWPAWTSQLASTIALTLFLMRSVQCCTCVLVMIETACVCVTCCCGASGDQIPRGPDLAGKVAVCRSELIPVVRMLLAFCMLAAFVCLWSSFEDFNCFAACCVLYSLSLPTLICIPGRALLRHHRTYPTQASHRTYDRPCLSQPIELVL
jgi:hypothetical protein